jgi:hypothetical protein
VHAVALAAREPPDRLLLIAALKLKAAT